MIYLSRIVLNSACRQARRDLARPYEMHRTVMRAFPDAYRGRVLFRLDSHRRLPAPILYVQSEDEPDWGFLKEVPGFLADPPDRHGNPAVRVLDLQPRCGDLFRFRLRANPTVKSSGRRWGLLRMEEQLEWLRRKGEAGGFRVGAGTVMAAPEGRRLTGWSAQDDERRPMTHLSVRFDGWLQVTDPKRFLQTLSDGIGSAKGFGFGMLTLAPA